LRCIKNLNSSCKLLERALSFETKFYICINSNIFSILRL